MPEDEDYEVTTLEKGHQPLAQPHLQDIADGHQPQNVYDLNEGHQLSGKIQSVGPTPPKIGVGKTKLTETMPKDITSSQDKKA